MNAEKPSLHEIAAMPFPSSQNAMRKYYNPQWGKPIPDGAEKQTYAVQIDFEVTLTDSRTVEVEAFTEEEAEELGSDLVGEELDGEYGISADVDFTRVHAKPRGDA